MNNSTTRYVETQLDLREILFRLLTQWKAVLIVALIAAAAVTGAKHVKDVKSYEANMKAQQEIQEDSGITEEERIAKALEPLNEKEQQDVMYTVNQNEWMESLKDYLKESILMNTDPTNQRTLTLNYYISSENSSSISCLVMGYAASANSTAVVRALADVINPGIDSKYIAELITVKMDQFDSINESSKGAVLKINIVIPDGTEGRAVEEAFTAAIKTHSSDMTSKIGEHKIELLSSNEAYLQNVEAINVKSNALNNINNVQNAIKNNQTNLSDAQKSAVSKILEIRGNASKKGAGAEGVDAPLAEELISPTEIPARPGYSKKYAVLGFMLGCMAYAFCYLFWVIARGRVLSSGDAEYYTGSRLLGDVYYDKPRTALYPLLNSALVNKFRYRCKEDTDRELDKIAKSIVAISEKTGAKVLTLLNLISDTEGYEGEKTAELIKKVVGAAKNAGVKLDVVPVGTDIESALVDIDNAIGVVGSDTKLSELGRMMELANEFEVKQLGTIYIGAR